MVTKGVVGADRLEEEEREESELWPDFIAKKEWI